MMTPEEAATPTLSQRKRKARMECTVCSKLITIIYVKNHMRDAHGIENFKLPKIEPKDESKLIDISHSLSELNYACRSLQ